jgi:hypothetical protein
VRALHAGYYLFSRYARVEAGSTKFGVICGNCNYRGRYSAAAIKESLAVRAYCTWDE